MEKLKREIHRAKRHRLEYYYSHLDIVENYIDEKPDISIETCKALIEGIAKLSLHVLNQEPLESHRNESLSPLCRRALDELQKGRGFSDADLCKRLSGIIQYIGEIRNEHGDIAHGRASLKDQVNDADFAELIIGVTESLCTYMLKRLDYLAEPVIEYDDNAAFNDYIDELHPMPNSIIYSKALYDQEPETYEIMLTDFNLVFNTDAE